MFQLDPTPTPQPGDVVISRVVQSPAVWILSSYQNEAQILCHTYDDALKRATTFSRGKHVDVFYSEDAGMSYVLVVRQRSS